MQGGESVPEFKSCWRTLRERGFVWMGIGGPMLVLWGPIALFDPAGDASVSRFAGVASGVLAFLFGAGVMCVVAPRFWTPNRLRVDAAAGTLTWNGRVYPKERVSLGPVLPDRWTGRRFDLVLRGDEPTTVSFSVAQWDEFRAIRVALCELVGEPPPSR